MRSRTARTGFTLMEVLLVMAVMAVVMGLLTTTWMAVLKMERASASALEQLRARHGLADQFRADVAEAMAAPERWQDETAGPACLILMMEKHRHIIYHWRDKRLMRSEYLKDRADPCPLPVGGATAVEFGWTGEHLLTLRLLAPGRAAPAEIVAALGGDRQ